MIKCMIIGSPEIGAILLVSRVAFAERLVSTSLFPPNMKVSRKVESACLIDQDLVQLSIFD